MFKLNPFFISMTLIAFLSIFTFAQKNDTPEPLPDNATFEVTKKWLLNALKHNFLFHVPRDKHDKTRYRMQELKLDDCLLSYSIYRADLVPTYPDQPAYMPNPGIPGVGPKPNDPNPSGINSGTNTSGPPINVPDINPGKAKSAGRGFFDQVLIDLREIDPASLTILHPARSKEIVQLQALNRSLTQPNVTTKAAATAVDAKVPPVARQTQGGIISLRTESAETIKAGLAHAIKLCQAP